MGKHPKAGGERGTTEALRRIAIAKANAAETLDLTDLGLAALPPEIGSLASLKALELKGNQLAALPPEIGSLSSLQMLGARGNQLSALPPDVGSLAALATLDLSNNWLTTLPRELGSLTSLEILNLSDNRLNALPSEVSSLVALRVLNLANNELTAVPPEIGSLSLLQKLVLLSNKLETLPREIGSLGALVFLELGQNRLSKLPGEIASLAGLRMLALARNFLRIFPPEITLLKKLEVLVLAINYIEEIPAEIGKLSQLRELYLGADRYSLSSWATDMVGLGTVGMRAEQNGLLTRVPREIGSLRNLELLDLGGHRLKELPHEIRFLTALKVLDLKNNRLKELPSQISSLNALQLLDLTNNELMALPRGMSSMSNLQVLYLHGNGGLGLAPEVLGPTEDDERRGANPTTPQAILDYYYRISTQEVAPLNEGKMILVGRGAVGKTSLVRRLRENKFDEGETKTEGIRIEPWEIALRSSERVLLHVWDFGGQEIMHATHRFFLTKRSLYLVVLNGREGGEDADAEYWLKTINTLAPDSPVLVVLNKHNCHPAALNRTGLRAKYPNVCGFVETDCAEPNPIGIATLEKEVKQAVDEHLPDVRAKFPASWSKIKDELSQMRTRLKKDFITFDEYRSLCASHDELDPVAQENLAGFLNDLGIALNYKDDPRLSDKHVLNPQWVTEGIYKILNASALAASGGAINLRQVGTILRDTDYPKAMHAFIFELMRKFELCFPFPDKDGEYLIPELLSKNEHADAQRFRKDVGATRFHYRYEVLPEGLIPRFIVRTYVHSQGLPRWRTGVVLRFEGNTALVWADVADGRAEVIVTGDPPSRRRLVAVIRSQFDHIHDNLKLRPREEVPVAHVPGLVLDYQDLLTYEREGATHPRIPFGGKLHWVDVMQLLNGLDVEGARLAMRGHQSKAVRLFYSYSSRDEEFRAELETHLALLEREGKLVTWHMRQIVPGTEWDKVIDENLKAADIILLMISSDFLASDYINDIEVQQAMRQHESGRSHVIPVFVRDCSWTGAPFGKLQGVPKGKAVKLWPDRDSAWREVSDWIRKIVDQGLPA